MYLGIDLGGTNIAAGVVDRSGRILHKASIPTKKNLSAKELCKEIALFSKSIVEGCGIGGIQSIGMGIPGTVNSAEGIVRYTVNIPMRDTPIAKLTREIIDLPVYLSNDANCAALGEAQVGAAKKVQNSVTITLGTGVGSGVIINKQIYEGFNYSASELGHIVIMMDGEPCPCGRFGCWEQYASASALIAQTTKAIEEHPDSVMATLAREHGKVSGRTAFDAMRLGDDTAKQVVDRYIKYVASGVVSVINAFQPEILVIGGGISGEGDTLINPLNEYVQRESFGLITPQTRIVKAALGNDAGIIGAALLAL